VRWMQRTRRGLPASLLQNTRLLKVTL